jgi:uncharacterized glyoxalase superfamily protein PhnB
MADKLNDRSPITPALYYDDAAAAVAWLELAFGLEPRFRV